MSIHHEKGPRRILPRWRASSKASLSAEFTSLKPLPRTNVTVESELQQQIDDFSDFPSLGTAAELVSLSMLSGNTVQAKMAAKFILDRRDQAPVPLLELAERALGNEPVLQKSSLRTDVCTTRRLLRINPDNPVLWSDMARHYASLGEKKKALRAMRTARALAPNHRWMLRTSSRFLVHQGDAIEAHQLLANHPSTKTDPWLIAAELACAQVAGRPPKFWRQATDILRWDRVPPLHLSELATAVAMMELESGERKKARRYVIKALQAPTENTLSQVFWAKANRHLNDGFHLDELVKSSRDAYEADYQVAMLNGDLISALNSAHAWSADEPFASRPYSEIAYVASLLDDHTQTVLMSHVVMRLDGKLDPSLELNVIFSRISGGTLEVDQENDQQQIGRIRATLERGVALGGAQAYHVMANLGLWHYRYGTIEDGRHWYQLAIAIAEKNQQLEPATFAAIFFAREAILIKDPIAPTLLQQAHALYKRSKCKTAAFYLRKLDALAANPDQALQILHPSSAARFLEEDKPASPAPLFRVESSGSGLILIVPKKTPGSLR